MGVCCNTDDVDNENEKKYSKSFHERRDKKNASINKKLLAKLSKSSDEFDKKLHGLKVSSFVDLSKLKKEDIR